MIILKIFSENIILSYILKYMDNIALEKFDFPVDVQKLS